MTPKKTIAADTSSQPLAFALLAEDHKIVDGLFRRYEALEDDDEEKSALIATICSALTAHARLEEELFYPELRAALDDEAAAMLDEAIVEHSGIKTLIAELDGAEPGDELVNAQMTVLAEYVRHHVKEEESEIFAEAKSAKDLDLDDLGERMGARKLEIEAEDHPDAALGDEDD